MNKFCVLLIVLHVVSPLLWLRCVEFEDRFYSNMIWFHQDDFALNPNKFLHNFYTIPVHRTPPHYFCSHRFCRLDSKNHYFQFSIKFNKIIWFELSSYRMHNTLTLLSLLLLLLPLSCTGFGWFCELLSGLIGFWFGQWQLFCWGGQTPLLDPDPALVAAAHVAKQVAEASAEPAAPKSDCLNKCNFGKLY